MKKKYSQSGQVVLITLLVLSVAITIVLSAIGRATTDIAITDQIAESSRAFSAAEAGIEEILKTGTVPSGAQTLSSGTQYTVQKADVGGATGVYLFPNKSNIGSSETVWLVSHNADGTLLETPTYTSNSLDICWSDEVTTPAILVSVFYKSGTEYKVARGAYDPDNSRISQNKFVLPTATSGGCGTGSGTTYKQTLIFSNFVPAINPAVDTLLALRVTPLYSSAQLAVSAVSALPLQGAKIESSGTTTNGITRKVVVYQQYRSPSSIFDSVVFSQNNFGR